MGCRTEPTIVHIAYVLQKLHFFSIVQFFLWLHNLPRKKITRTDTFFFHRFDFFFTHTTYRKRKVTRFYRKKVTRFDDFFVHELHFSTKIPPGEIVLVEFVPCDPPPPRQSPCEPPQSINKSPPPPSVHLFGLCIQQHILDHCC